MKVYSDEDMLMLSGIQHIAFCERQWALIHIEQQWQDNVLTVEGQHLHERSDDPFQDNVKGNVIMWRSIAVISYSLGLYGHADVVELEPANNDDKNSILITNLKEVNQSQMNAMRFNYAPRLYVLKKCTALTSLMDSCIMAQPVIVMKFSLIQS
mgnify:CR=1 FL=1